MSRQNYYARRRRRAARAIDAELVLNLVRAERRCQPRLGTRKLRYMLKGAMQKAGVVLGRDRFFGLLREADLLVEPLPRDWVNTTCSQHKLPVYPNLIRDLAVSEPNKVWVVDLTYVRTEEGFMFLALVTDKGSRKIVGYHCAENLEAGGCVRALRMALAELPAEARPIHHSDRGTQYCSHEYGNVLAERELPISMTEKNHCAENALAERVNGILKGEYGLGGRLESKALARQVVDQAIETYNERRPHTALQLRTPSEAHRLTKQERETMNEGKEIQSGK
jgi:transposase InsO family protein